MRDGYSSRLRRAPDGIGMEPLAIAVEGSTASAAARRCETRRLASSQEAARGTTQVAGAHGNRCFTGEAPAHVPIPSDDDQRRTGSSQHIDRSVFPRHSTTWIAQHRERKPVFGGQGAVDLQRFLIRGQHLQTKTVEKLEIVAVRAELSCRPALVARSIEDEEDGADQKPSAQRELALG